MTLRAIYRNGVFKPAGPVDFPEESEVELEAKLLAPGGCDERGREEQAQKEILDILSHRYNTGQTDTAARHNEHQP